MAMHQCVKFLPTAARRFAVGTRTPVSVRGFFSPSWSRTPDVGALIRDMDRQMDRLEREVFRGMPSLFPRHAINANLLADHTLSPQEGQYRVSVDLAGYRPEEVSLSLDESGRRLTVSAKCERRGRDGSRFAQEVTRVVSLPESVDVDKLSSTLHRDGVLAIEAPFKEQPPQQDEQHAARSIPIQRVGASGEGGGEQPRIEQNKEAESTSG